MKPILILFALPTPIMSNTVDLLPANLQGTLHQIVQQSNSSGGGIQVILLSTAEGVPLGRVYADRSTPLNEDVLSSVESTWAPASKQFPLLNMGKEARTVTAIYDHGTFFVGSVDFRCQTLAHHNMFSGWL